MKNLDKQQLDTHKAPHREPALDRADEHKTRACVIVPIRRLSSLPFASDSGLSQSERLEEAQGLARAIGLDVCFSGCVTLSHPKPSTLIGSGKVEEIAGIAQSEKVEVIIVDHALTPIQQRNLEKAWNVKVLDRTGLILEIFADRAQSKEGRLQVELARLTYQKSRLVRSWTHLERQRGGFGFLGGPGETQIEADRRAIGERIDNIRNELSVIERTRRLHRKRRKASRQPLVALVGYTNAGKSTLFNAFSGAQVLAKDMLFATLDPTLRRIQGNGGSSFILSDTVGFISELPTQLIAAFRATLEEVIEADLIIHVRDIASASSSSQAHDVESVLKEMGIDPHQGSRIIEVWNKADLLGDQEHHRLQKLAKHCERPTFLVSAKTGAGLQEVLAFIQSRFAPKKSLRDLKIPDGDGALIHWLYENTEIVDRQDHQDGHLHFQVLVSEEKSHDLEQRLATFQSL